MLFALIGVIVVVLAVKHRQPPPVAADPMPRNDMVDPQVLESPPLMWIPPVEANPLANDVAPIARPPSALPGWAQRMTVPPRVPVTKSTLVDKEAGVLQLQSDGRLRAIDGGGRPYEPDATVYLRVGVPVPFDVSVPPLAASDAVPKVARVVQFKPVPASMNVRAGSTLRPTAAMRPTKVTK